MRPDRRLFLAVFCLGVFVLSLHLIFPPEISPLSAGQHQREILIRQYLMFDQTPSLKFEDFDRFLQDRFKTMFGDPLIGEAVALFYAQEGREQKAKAVLKQLPEDYNAAPLTYALGYSDQPPSAWRDTLREDWVGKKMASLIYRRNKDETEFARVNLQLRYFENQARRSLHVLLIYGSLKLIGFGLLLSMMVVSRHFRAAGKVYFRLSHLPFSQDTLIRFCGFFILGFLAIGQVFQFWMAGRSIWLIWAITYLAQMCWGLFLLARFFFAGIPEAIAPVLGFRNLKMDWLGLLQIIGGVAILATCYQMAMDLAALIHWPEDAAQMSARYQELFQSPLLGGGFMLLACIAAPFFEEVLFRGLIFRTLLYSLKPWQAMFLSAMLFALLHPLTAWPGTFAMGLALALIYFRTGNLLVNIWVHAFWNGSVLWLSYLDVL